MTVTTVICDFCLNGEFNEPWDFNHCARFLQNTLSRLLGDFHWLIHAAVIDMGQHIYFQLDTIRLVNKGVARQHVYIPVVKNVHVCEA